MYAANTKHTTKQIYDDNHIPDFHSLIGAPALKS